MGDVVIAMLPTALLSTHSGDFYGFTKRDLSDELLPIAQHWKREGVHFDGIYTGYLASAQQVELIEQILDLLATPESIRSRRKTANIMPALTGKCVRLSAACARARTSSPRT